MKPCGTCKQISINHEIYNVNPEKLDSVVLKYLPKTIQIYHNHIGQNFKIHHLIPNQYIFYFATYSRDPNLSILHKDDAYGDLNNSGIALINTNGSASLHLECPQIYIFDDGKIYHRHIHFVYWNSKLKKWENNLYTHPILCIVNYHFVRKWHSSVKIVNALSRSDFQKNKIPNSVNLPYNELWNEKDVKKILNIKNKHYPIIVYCMNKKCKAGESVCKRLASLGFYNIYHYANGIEEWKKLFHNTN
jgi:rhodanese-related sulfurtransferase